MDATLDIKSFIISDVNEDQETTIKPAKRVSEKVYRLEVNSGIDAVISRETVGRKASKMFLVLLASQQQFYVKTEKTGEITPLTDSSLKNFFNGLMLHERWECEHPVFNYFCHESEFRNKFIKYIHDPMFLEMAKKGVTNIETYNPSFTKAGYIGRLDDRDGSLKEAAEGMNKIALKNAPFVRRILQTYVDSKGVDYGQALRENSIRSIEPFILLKTVFGENNALSMYKHLINNDLYGWFPNCHDIASLFGECKVTANNGICLVVPRGQVVNFLGHHMEFERVFDAKRFEEYLFDNSMRTGYADQLSSYVNLWADTLNMQNNVYGKIKEKYPKDLLLLHNVLSFKVRVIKREIDKELWAAAVEKASKYESEAVINGTKWLLVAPKTESDIINESMHMSNCVSSYIKRMEQGRCTIMFLRRAKAPDASYCTVEIMDDAVVQFKGKWNRTPNKEACVALQKLCEKVNVKY